MEILSCSYAHVEGLSVYKMDFTWAVAVLFLILEFTWEILTTTTLLVLEFFELPSQSLGFGDAKK